MYRLIIACVSSILVCAGATAESKKEKIERAISAAPSMISAKATVLDMDGSELRKGENGWTCYPGVPLIPGSVDPMCNDSVWQAWIAAATKGDAFETKVIGFSYMLQGDGLVSNDDPGASDQSKGTWIKEGPHLMLLLPKSAVDGLSTTPTVPGPYVMWGDTPMFHLMVPIADRPEGALVVHDH
ncbi:MAG: hypothetical protein ACI9GW_001698 [Halieaceae bacterium]|jgi:hypothetical protein